MIRIHGGPYTRKLMNLILQRLNYFINCFLINMKNSSDPQNIPSKTKNKIKTIALEERFVCAGVYDLAEKNVPEGKREEGQKKYLFQVQYEMLKHWFDLDIECVKEISVQDNPSFTRDYFNAILKVNLEKVSYIS